MNRDRIRATMRTIVGWHETIGNTVRPARVLDHRLWELHRGPEPHVKISTATRFSASSSLVIGYPVLTMTSGKGHTPEQLVAAERFLADTVLTMGDLFDEQGEDKGILGTKGILSPKGIPGDLIIFRVVSPADLYEDYWGKRAEVKAADDAMRAEMSRRQVVLADTRKHAEHLNMMFSAVGVESDDDKPVVQAQGLGSSRVNLPVDVLLRLMACGGMGLNGCEWCAVCTFLLPFEREGEGVVMLCATCHPCVSV